MIRTPQGMTMATVVGIALVALLLAIPGLPCNKRALGPGEVVYAAFTIAGKGNWKKASDFLAPSFISDNGSECSRPKIDARTFWNRLTQRGTVEKVTIGRVTTEGNVAAVEARVVYAAGNSLTHVVTLARYGERWLITGATIARGGP